MLPRPAAPLLMVLSLFLTIFCHNNLAEPLTPDAQAGGATAKTSDYLEDSDEQRVPLRHSKQGYSGGSYYKTDNGGYDTPYGDQDECPNPQAADSVSNAYISHYSFVWADLAAELAPPKPNRTQSSPTEGQPAAGKAAPDPKLRELLRRALRRGSNQRAAAASPPPATAAAAGGAAAAGAGTQQAAHPAPAASGPSTSSSSSGSSGSGDEAVVKVLPAAVTNPGFLLPTSSKYESGRGFAGTSSRSVPTQEALAVGPHPGDKDSVLVMHGIYRVWEVFAASRDGHKIPSNVPTRIPFPEITNRMGFPAYPAANGSLLTADPDAYYDKKADRFVISWSTNIYFAQFTNASTRAPLIVCVSEDANALGRWTCWALSTDVEVAPLVPYCGGHPVYSRTVRWPKTSYSADGIYVSITLYCLLGGDVYDYEDFTYLSAVFALPKTTLYQNPAPTQGGDVVVWRATYFPTSSWFRSLCDRDQALEYDPRTGPFNSFNSQLLPSRPQTAADVPEGPIFVMGKVDGNRYMSIARLTGQPLDRMDSIATAPRIYATVLAKPDFSNTPGSPPDPQGVIPQPGNNTDLYGGDVGIDVGSATYGATHTHGRVYVATSEFFGSGSTTRRPSVYWAIVDPSRHLCKPSVEHWGMVASEQGLSLAFPTIAARHECGAVLAYAYGSKGDVRLNGQTFPAYAGAASTTVGCTHADPEITIIKRGEIPITRYPEDNPQIWGTNSAVDFLDDAAWFAVAVALNTQEQYGSWIWRQPCGGQRE